MKKSLSNIVIALFCFATLFLCFSCSADSENNSGKTPTPDPKPIIDPKDFSVTALARDRSIYFEWIEPEGVEFESLDITCEPSSEENRSIHLAFDIKPAAFYRSINVDSGCEYEVTFVAYGDDGATYKKEFNLTTKTIISPVQRQTAIVVDGKTYVSWTLDSEDYVESRLYNQGERLVNSEVVERLAYEEIAEGIADNIETYKKYYSCVIDKELAEGLELQIRAVNSKKQETCLSVVSVRKVNLPVVKIDFDLNTSNYSNFVKKDKLDATLSVLNCENVLSDAVIAIKGRGNSSWLNAPKKSYTIKFDNKQEFLGMSRNKSFALVANYFDKTLLRNVAAYELGRTVFDNLAWTPDSKSVNLFINGVYQGVYDAVESVKIDKARINIKSIEDYENVLGSEEEENNNFFNYGYLLEVNERLDEDFNFVTSYSENVTSKEDVLNPVPFSLKEPEGGDVEDVEKDKNVQLLSRIEEYVNDVQKRIYSPDFVDEYSENYYGKYIHVDSFIDWWLVEELAKNTDSNFFSSCYMYFDPEDKLFHMGPLWDFDLGFGNNKDDTLIYGYKTDEQGDMPLIINQNKVMVTRGNWILRIKQDSLFNEKARNRWNELSPLVKKYFEENYCSNLNELKKDAELNFVRWPILGEAVWKSPTGYENRTTYEDEVELFNEWVDDRIQWISASF